VGAIPYLPFFSPSTITDFTENASHSAATMKDNRICHDNICFSITKKTVPDISDMGTSGSVVGRDAMLQAGRSRARIRTTLYSFNLSNLSSLTMTQRLIEISTRNLPGKRGKARPARKADNLTAICVPFV
jgi:hypothetical protein